MPHIRRKMKAPTAASPSSLSMSVEENCLTSWLTLVSFQKRWLGHTSTKWWMDYITFTKKVMLTETLSLKTFFFPTCTSSKLPISDLPVTSKAKITLEYWEPSWELKAIWLLKFLLKNTKERVLIFLHQGSSSSSCTLEIHLLRKLLQMILTTNSSRRRDTISSGRHIAERDLLASFLTALKTSSQEWLPLIP